MFRRPLIPVCVGIIVLMLFVGHRMNPPGSVPDLQIRRDALGSSVRVHSSPTKSGIGPLLQVMVAMGDSTYSLALTDDATLKPGDDVRLEDVSVGTRQQRFFWVRRK